MIAFAAGARMYNVTFREASWSLAAFTSPVRWGGNSDRTDVSVGAETEKNRGI
jgi:hypothetical protein